MKAKVGRNDSCPCGSNKKYKNCCMHINKPVVAGGKKKFKATLLSAPKSLNLIERTYSKSIEAVTKGEKSESILLENLEEMRDS